MVRKSSICRSPMEIIAVKAIFGPDGRLIGVLLTSTILLIEQNAKLALESSQRAYVMESGEITLNGPSTALLHDPKVRAAYLGE